MKRFAQYGNRSILLLSVFLLPASVIADESKTADCRAALEKTEYLATLDAEEGRLWSDVALENCNGVEDPELMVRSAVLRAERMAKAEARPFLEQTVASYEDQKLASSSLVPLVDQLVTASLQDECDVEAATKWADKAAALRSTQSEIQRNQSRDLGAQASHRFAIATCLMELGREKEALMELRGAEATLREALHAQTRQDSFDSELRMYLIDGLRVTLDQLGATLDPELEDEYDRLLHQSK